MKIWAIENESSVKHLLTLPPFNSSVMALSWVGLDRNRNDGLIAVGMENGLIELWSLSARRAEDGSVGVSGASCGLVVRFDPFMCHISAVHRLAWRESEKSEDSLSLELGSCGADHCVRVFEVSFT